MSECSEYRGDRIITAHRTPLHLYRTLYTVHRAYAFGVVGLGDSASSSPCIVYLSAYVSSLTRCYTCCSTHLVYLVYVSCMVIYCGALCTYTRALIYILYNEHLYNEHDI